MCRRTLLGGRGDPADLVTKVNVAFCKDLCANTARQAHVRQAFAWEVLQAAWYEPAKQDRADLEGLLDEARTVAIGMSCHLTQ